MGVSLLAFLPCTNLGHGIDGSVRDKQGRCWKCEQQARWVASGFGETLEAEKEGFEPSIPENGSGTGVHASSGKDKP